MLHEDAHSHAAALKDTGAPQPLLGCAACADRRICGELHLQDTGSLLLSCMDHCTCPDPAECQMVCPRNAATFANRFHEVDGWDLNNIPTAQMLAMPHLPNWIPLFQGDLTGKRPAGGEPFVALPLTLALAGAGLAVRGRTTDELVRSYGAKPFHGWVLSGTEGDPAVERVWKLPDLSRVARQLRQAGVVFATTPNFSLVLDSPRYDNLHAMKRIAWAWYRMTQGGLCTALHLNGRTDHDFVRWAEFVRARPEVKAVAFEFLTGSATRSSADLYVRRLKQFSYDCGRKMPLVIRGHAHLAHELSDAYSQVILLDSAPYMRATKRRKAFLKGNGALGHSFVPTATPRETRALLLHNLKVHRAHAEVPARSARPIQGELDLRMAPSKAHADDESTQLSLFADERGAI